MRPKQRPDDHRSAEDGDAGLRPGAYWSGGGDQGDAAGDDDGAADLEVPAVAPTTTTGYSAPSPRQPSPRRPPPPRPPQSRDPSVLLEAEPVLSILVDATPMPEPPERWRPPRLTRRQVAILLGIVAVVAAVAAGIAVGATSSPNTATESGDELRDVPAPSPASNCPAWGDECLSDSNVNAQACIECYNAYNDLVPEEATCGEITSLICAQIENCTSSCGSCGPSIEAYETCKRGSDCFRSCTNISSSTPTSPSPRPPTGKPTTRPNPSSSRSPSAAPTADPCPSEHDAYSGCVRASGVSIDACNDCLGEFSPETIDTCDESEFYTCGAMGACPACGDCHQEYVAWTNCLNEGDCAPFPCPAPATNATAAAPTTTPIASGPSAALPPSAAPSADPCEAENDAYGDCIRASGVSIAACDECILEIKPETIGTCAESLFYTCGAMDACPECGNCGEQFVAWTNCGNEGDCEPFACDSSASNATTPGPTATPVPSSS